MGRDKLRIVEYSTPELQVPASDETRHELSPYCLNMDSSPRLYPKSERAVSPHFPPVERMPVPVTPFPKLYRDDSEPT